VSCYVWIVRAVACVALIALGCGNHEFVCASNDQCVDGDVQGTCEPTAFCSFPDTSCDSQRRYGELAASDLAGQCVELNLVLNGTCDVDTSGWQPFESTLSLSTTAHTGAHSCMVCATGGPDDFTMDDVDPTVPSADPGEMFLGQAWVRTAPGAANPTTAYLEIRDSTTQFGDTSNMPALDDTWQPVMFVHTVGSPTQPVEVLIAGHTDAPSTKPCFLVDDITLVRVQ
jgi:hypothetical protein